MSYDSDVLEVKGVQEGYDALETKYVDYHQWLDGFDKCEWKKYLPRHLDGLEILEIGAGDGRTSPFFEWASYRRYVACDVSSVLLAMHPWNNVEKVVCDVEQWLPFADASFDFATSFFVLEHIANVRQLFEEMYRVLKPNSRWIVTYFPQRRAFVHKLADQSFKIESYQHRYEDLEHASNAAFFSFSMTSISDWWKEVGRAYCFLKH